MATDNKSRKAIPVVVIAIAITTMTIASLNNNGAPKVSKKDIRLMRQDTAIGMAFSQIIMWAIITTTAGSLNAHGVTDIQSADQAAKALEPVGWVFWLCFIRCV